MIITGDAITTLRNLDSACARACITSPPYWRLRDYGVDGQIGIEATPEEFVERLVEVFREVRRVLTKDGTLWLNLGDSYAAGGNGGGGSFMAAREHTAWANRARLKGFRKAPPGLKEKDLVGIPWLTAFALRNDGWYLRSEIIWHKPNAMPESALDRPCKAHEHIFLLSRSISYFFNDEALEEIATSRGYNTKRRRTVWTIPTQPNKLGHFAMMPSKLARDCILAGSEPDDLVIDPFNGAGTTGVAALELGRRYLGIELNHEYAEISRRRLSKVQPTIFPQGGG